MLTRVWVFYTLQKNAKVVAIDDYEDVPVNNEQALQKAVANQPVSVAIEGGGRAFQFYESVRDCLCVCCQHYSYGDIIVLILTALQTSKDKRLRYSWLKLE